MQYTMRCQQNDKDHAIQNQIPTKRYNPRNTHSNTNKTITPMQYTIYTNKTIKPMQYTIKYQPNDKTYDIHNQLGTKR